MEGTPLHLETYSYSFNETEELGSALSELVEPGDIVELRGELGVGKTVFAKGFARGLGVSEAVSSPTFLMVKRYVGRLVLLHCDLYRLAGRFDVEMLGIDEEIDDGAVALLEWGEVAQGGLGAGGLIVSISHVAGEDLHRSIGIDVGQDWKDREGALRQIAGRGI